MSVGGDYRTLISGILRRIALPAIVISLACIPAVTPRPASAQDFSLGTVTPMKPKAGSQMLVEAEELVYDYDKETISAVGNVKLYYMGYTLEADRVLPSGGRLLAVRTIVHAERDGEQVPVLDWRPVVLSA